MACSAYLAALFFLCLSSGRNFPTVDPYFLGIPIDKVIHFAMFFPATILLYLSEDRIKKRKTALAAALFISLAIAGITELLQGLTPDRCPDALDFLADTVAIFLSASLLLPSSIRRDREDGSAE